MNPFEPPLTAHQTHTHFHQQLPPDESVLKAAWRGAKFGGKMAGIPLAILGTCIAWSLFIVNVQNQPSPITISQLLEMLALNASLIIGLTPIILSGALAGAVIWGSACAVGRFRQGTVEQ